MAVTDALPAIPFDRPNVLEIAPMYVALQTDQPVIRVRTPAGDVAWLVTGYDLVKDLFNDERLGRAHPDPEHAPRFSSSAFLGGPAGDYETEKADHARMRRLLTRSFMVKRMNGLRPHVQALVDELLDRLAGTTPPADLHEALSFPLPVLVICELLGVPYADRDRFRAWSRDASNLWDREAATAGHASLRAYMHDLVRAKRGDRGEDVISDLIDASDEDGPLSEARVVDLSAGLLFAGHETTVARIDFGTLLLLVHDDQRDALQREPSLVPRAVEEILRMAAPNVGVIPRYASADIEIAGTTIRAGDLILLGREAANRDGRVFPQPERFDIRREPNPHVAFGHGHHFCLGAGLARVELQAVFGTLFRRFPSLRLAAPLDELRLRPNTLTGGLEALPIAW